MSHDKSRESEIFGEALELGSLEEQRAFVKGACGDDEALRRAVDGLLEAYSHAEGFIPERSTKPTAAPGQPSSAEVVGSLIGRYKLLEKIGEGGCGVVYVAEQQEPVRRRVALKLIKLGMDTRQVIARFESERQALALMDHPNIARVLDAGATDTGRPFFVMELVRGIKITDYCDQHQLSTAERLDLFVQVCRAVQHAHQKGIIHRDLKPSNILVTVNDGVAVPKVIDFGIAKATEARLTDKTVYTELHQFIGTPAYMSPEQAEMTSVDIDTRSDIYSLGVLLYELLTGKTPFDHQELVRLGLDAMRRTIREKEPPRPSTRLSTLAVVDLSTVAKARRSEPPKLIHSVRGDLDWIVMKCLEKDRTRRYDAANGLARDLERHLSDEPVVARSPSAAYRFRKFVSRNKLAVAAAVLVAGALVVGLCASTWEAVRARRAEREQSRLRQAAETAQTKEAAQRQRAQAGERLAERLLYASKMNLAQQAWDLDQVQRVRQLLEETADFEDRGFEWYYWQGQMHRQLKTLYGNIGELEGIAFSPDGHHLVMVGSGPVAKIWDYGTGKEELSLVGHSAGMFGVAYSPDGRLIATASSDHTARIWDSATGAELRRLIGHSEGLQLVRFSSDGRRVATAGWDRIAKVWDTATGHLLLSLEGHRDRVLAVAFSPDGRLIATGSADDTVKIWDAASGAPLLSLPGHAGEVWSVAFAPDGRRLASGGGDQLAKVWDVASGKEILNLRGHRDVINALTFFPDGRRILTGSADGVATLWNAVSGEKLFALKGHTSPIDDVAFSPDGRLIATASRDQTVRIWDAAGDLELDFNKSLKPNFPDQPFISVAFSADGQRLVTGNINRLAAVWEVATGKHLLTLVGHSGPPGSAAFSPDGKKVVTGGWEGTARVWDATTGNTLLVLTNHDATVYAAGFSPDGRRIVTGSLDGTAKVWDALDGHELLTIKGHEDGICAAAFSPDGRRIVTGGLDNTAKVWDAAGGQQILTLTGHTDDVLAAAFSSDGRMIVTGSADHTARLWAADTGRDLLTLNGHSAAVVSVAFAPDSHRILTASEDSTARLWDALTGRELLSFKGQAIHFPGVAFSPNGDRVATLDVDGNPRIWQAATSNQVALWQAEEKADAARRAALGAEQAAAGLRDQAAQAKDPGTIKEWLVLFPIPFGADKDGRVALAQEKVPGEANLRPRAGQRATVESAYDTGERVWRAVHLRDYQIDFNRLLHYRAFKTLGYAVSYILSDSDQTGLQMKVGSDDESKVYLNGKLLYEHSAPRGFMPDEDVVGEVELNAGVNVLVFKVVNELGDWKGSIRFTDAAGQPVRGIHVTLTPPAASR